VPADHADTHRQAGNGPTGTVEQPIGLEMSAGIGDGGCHGALAHRGDLFGHQLQLAPFIDPLQAAYDRHPLTGHDPTARLAWPGHRHADLGRAVPQREPRPARAAPLHPVHLALHGVTEFGAQITIRQGEEIKRPSVLYARVDGRPGGIERVTVGGSAVIVARGEYRLS